MGEFRVSEFNFIMGQKVPSYNLNSVCKEPASIMSDMKVPGYEDTYEPENKETDVTDVNANANIRKQTYDVVLKIAIEGRKNDAKIPAEKEKIKKLAERETARVIKACEKYGMAKLAPVIALRLGKETGGFIYPGESRGKQSLHSSSGNYFGAMQTNNTALKTIYGENSKESSIKKEYDNYLSQDKKYIDSIKNRYDTIPALKKQMATDVDLGLEIGILYFRLKLRMAKYNLNEAHRNYTNKQNIPSYVPHPSIYNIDNPNGKSSSKTETGNKSKTNNEKNNNKANSKPKTNNTVKGNKPINKHTNNRTGRRR